MTLDEWNRLECEIVSAWTSRDRRLAQAKIDLALREGSDEVRGRALLYRASMMEEEGNGGAALNDFIEASTLLPKWSYVRYTAELSAGHAAGSGTDAQRRVQWYQNALRTCVAAPEPFSGAAAAVALLSATPQLSQGDIELIGTVIAKSWQVLGMPGEAPLDDLMKTAKELVARGSKSSG